MSYEVKGKTTKINAVSRCAMCIKDKRTGKDNYYTIEVSEERVMPDSDSIDLAKEYDALFDSINSVVDNQMEDIVNAIKA